MKKPLGIIFDLGGTILEYRNNNPINSITKILEMSNNAQYISTHQLLYYFDILIKDTFDDRYKSYTEISFKNFLRLLYESFSIKFNKPYEEIERIYYKYAFKTFRCKGIVELLEFIEKLNIKVGILSNSTFDGEILAEDLKAHSIYSYFKFVISSANYCLRKPSIHIFNLAIKKMGFDPGDIWYVGDNIYSDIEGAVSAGLFPVWYNKKGDRYNGDLDYIEVKDYKYLNKIIEKLYM